MVIASFSGATRPEPSMAHTHTINHTGLSAANWNFAWVTRLTRCARAIETFFPPIPFILRLFRAMNRWFILLVRSLERQKAVRPNTVTRSAPDFVWVGASLEADSTGRSTNSPEPHEEPGALHACSRAASDTNSLLHEYVLPTRHDSGRIAPRRRRSLIASGNRSRYRNNRSRSLSGASSSDSAGHSGRRPQRRSQSLS